MRVRPGGSGNGISCAMVVFCGVIGGFDTTTEGGEAPRQPDPASAIRCGRLRSLMSQPRQAPIAMGDLASREALAHTDILHYALDLEVSNLDPVGNTCLITGSNAMTIQSKSDALDEFTFRLREQYVILNAYVNGSTPVAVTTTSETTRAVNLDRTYGLDEIFSLTIEYQGDSVYIPNIGGSIKVDTQPDDTPVVGTLSQPYYSYSWWPVKEGDVGAPGDHSDKFTMEFAVTAPDTFISPANGVLQGIDVLPDNRKRYRWASDYPNTPQLVAFAATEYNTWTVGYDHAGGTMPVEFYIYPEWDTPEHREAWELAVTALGVYASLFGEYPFANEKYGIYNFPWAGLEHQTISGQGQEGGYTGFGEYLTVHELAHQWWGDSVSCRTWNHIWISEGFASYADALWDEHKPGGSFALLQAVMAERREAAALSENSVYVPDDELGDIWRLFSPATTYRKSAWVLHMLRHLLGDDDFFAVLQAFQADFQYQAATTEDFQAVCEAYYEGGSLDWFFQQWIYECCAPAYNWGWQSVEVNGQHYLLLYIDQPRPAGIPLFTMPIDLAVDGTTQVVWNDADPEHFVIPVTSTPVSVALDPEDWVLWRDRREIGYVPGPPTIVETDPSPGETVDYADVIDTIELTFHTNVDAELSGIALTGSNTGSRSFTLTTGSDVNPLVLNLDLPLLPDTYTLLITGGVTAVNSGMALDGEVSDPNDPASLPSGDGEPGGEAAIQFVVMGDPPGDFDDDGDVDEDDYAAFVSCFTGPNGGPVSTTCQRGDFDLDDDVDCIDWDQFVAAWSAGGEPPEFEPCNVVPPAHPSPPDDTPKNRYLTIDSTTNIRPVAYEVVLTESAPYPTAIGRAWWVGEPVCYDKDGHECPGEGCLLDPALPDCAGADAFGWVSMLTAAPVSRLWSESPLHITECGIAPVVTYEIRASGDDGVTFSERLEVHTAGNPQGDAQSWGDVTGGPDPITPGEWLPPDGSMNFGDIGNSIRTFENRTEDTGFPPRAWVDIEINQVVNLGDIQFLVMAFEGRPYADINLPLIGMHPADCP